MAPPHSQEMSSMENTTDRESAYGLCDADQDVERRSMESKDDKVNK